MTRFRISDFGLPSASPAGFRIARLMSTGFFAVLFTTFSVAGVAQKASFIYIQGDKKTPFYVKLGGEMQPRYGKNYCIIPELTAGVANIEVLFQQNAFPAQKFAIKIPDGGERGFLIVEKSGEISLYDLEQEFYLRAGNAVEEDHLPQRKPASMAAAPPPKSPPPSPALNTYDRKTVRQQQEARRLAAERRVQERKDSLARARASAQASTPPESANQPRFIPGLSLDTTARNTSGAGSAAGCGEAMDVQAFAALYRSVLDIGDQDERLVFLNKKTDACYSPTQLRLLARVLDRDAARYTFLKKVQPRITVAARFAELEDLLSSEAYRARFRELL